MTKVKLGDVAKEAKLTYKGDKTDINIVGLEHLIPENLTLSNWAVNTENTFTKAFKKGHVLFGRRRAYLKKAVVAPFDGICSGDITVIEALPEKILPDLLPFIIQNDDLFAYAVENSAGGLSPRVKWENLKTYEFDLPDMDEQKRLAKILWAAEEVKQNLISTISQVKNMLVSYIFEFDINMDNFEKMECFCKMYQPKYISTSQISNNGDYPVFGANGIIGYYSEYNHENPEIALTCRGATCGTINLTLPCSWITSNAMVIRSIDNSVMNEYLYYYLRNFDFASVITGGAQPQITRTLLNDLEIPIPKLDKQSEFISAVKNIDAVINKINSEIANVQDIQKKFLRRDNNV